MDRLDLVLRLLWIWMAADVAIVAYLSFVRSRNSGFSDDDALLTLAPEREASRGQAHRVRLVPSPSSPRDRF